VLCFMLLLLRYLMVAIFSSIFSENKLTNLYYFEYIRFSFLTYLGTVLLILICVFTYRFNADLLFPIVTVPLVTLLTLRTIFIGIKTSNTLNFKLVHLFSYLCPVEFIPTLLLFNYLLK
jgi:hypothetical protein